MKRRFDRTVFLPMLFLVLSVAAFAQTGASTPSLELNDLGGHHFRLADFKGKVVLLNFWATWCPPCRTEIPELVKWQLRYRTQGLQVIGITYPPQTRAEVLRFTRRVGVNYPVALGTNETKRVFTSSETLPATVVIDADGNIRDVIEGIVFPEEFAQKIKPLLTSQTRNLTITKRLAKRTSNNLQRATIFVDAEGYRPTNVVVRRGIPTRLTFIRKAAEGCGTEIVIPAYGINRPLPLNVPVVVSFTPNRSGRFKLTCGMDMFRGSLIVK